MTESGNLSGPGASVRQSARWRTIGVVVLAVGIVVACLVYWLERPPPDMSDVMPTAQDSKVVARKIEMDSGKAGLLADELMAALQNPGTQAILIVVVASLVSSGCFYVAHLLEKAGRRRDEPVTKA